MSASNFDKNLIVTSSGKVRYYSRRRDRWENDVGSISLQDICGLSSDERDIVLDHWRRIYHPRMLAAQNAVDAVDKAR